MRAGGKHETGTADLRAWVRAMDRDPSHHTSHQGHGGHEDHADEEGHFSVDLPEVWPMEKTDVSGSTGSW